MRFGRSIRVVASIAAVAVCLATGCNNILGNESATIGDLAPDGSVPVVDNSLANPPDASSPDTLADPTPPDASDSATAPEEAGQDAAPDGPAPNPGCEAGKKLCDGVCVAKADPLFGCGDSTCSPCSLSRATAVCAGAACAVSSCNSGYADCDQKAATGCETDLSTVQTCGACNAVCGVTAPYCAPSGASFGCTTGCAGNAPTLCGDQCADLTSAANHCGSCSTICPTVANGKTSCAQSACKFTCDAGYHACGGACVSNSSPATCGGSCTPCVAPANATATCDGVTCGFTCAAGFHRCGATCASNTDPATCGTTACTACPSGASSTATCNGTSCGLTCAATFGDCDMNPANGCERALTTDPLHCGACGHSCGAQTCTAGVCDAPPPMDAGGD